MTTVYIAKSIDDFEYSPGGWKGTKVGVFRVENGEEEQVGEYVRNYGTLFHTFFPFEKNGRQLALYSSHYTATRIMELPSCKDIGGEEPHELGFCPVDYFVPTFIDQQAVVTSNLPGSQEKTSIHRINNPTDDVLAPYTREYKHIDVVTNEECRNVYNYAPLRTLSYYEFGFVSGCVWGDDSTYKVQYLDLSEADRGILKRDDRFGYVEIPDNIRLKDVIDMYDYAYCDVSEDEIAGYIRISTLQTFDLKTGKTIGP